jgi:hypothetical protein
MKIHFKVLAAVTAIVASGTVAFLTSRVQGKEPRFAQLTLEQLDDQQRPLGEKILKISSVGIAVTRPLDCFVASLLAMTV